MHTNMLSYTILIYPCIITQQTQNQKYRKKKRMCLYEATTHHPCTHTTLTLLLFCRRLRCGIGSQGQQEAIQISLSPLQHSVVCTGLSSYFQSLLLFSCIFGACGDIPTNARAILINNAGRWFFTRLNSCASLSLI